MEERHDEGIIKGAKISKLLKDTNLNYMEDYICKISGNKIGTGFFCKIEHNNELIPVLMTNYHVIDDNYIKNNKQLNLYINNNIKIINIYEDSKIYSSETNKYDIMIIKIKKEYKINNYLELEQNIFINNSENFLKDEKIYILHYQNNDKAKISYGKGIEIINNYDIKHYCNTGFGSSGGPILNALNNKVIGIHKGFVKKNDDNSYNIGTFLKFPLYKMNIIGEFISKPLYSNDFDNIFKFIILDPSNNTDIFKFLKKKENINFYWSISMLGIDRAILCYKLKTKLYKIEIWQRIGVERYRCIPSSHISSGNCLLFIYNISERGSFLDIKGWMERFDFDDDNFTKMPVPVLIGNNFQRGEKREVTYEEGQSLANKYRMKFYELSCITEENINEIFFDSIKEITKKIEEGKKNNDITLVLENEEKKSICLIF